MSSGRRPIFGIGLATERAAASPSRDGFRNRPGSGTVIEVKPATLDSMIAALAFALGAALVAVENGGAAMGSVALTATYTLPLAWSRRLPLATLLACVAGLTIVVLVDARASVVVLLALMLAGYSAGRRLDPPQSHIAIGAAVGVPISVAALTSDAAPLADQVLFGVLVAGAWLAGRTSRVRAQHVADLARRVELAERTRDELGRRAVVEERTRIARELHDIITHSISVITLQAAGVRRRLRADQRAEADGLRDIETAARDAMVELRRLLGVLHNDGDRPPLAPQPGLDQLPRLLEQTAAAGLPVELQVEGERRHLAASVDLAAYRIVQEALTNTLRHAGPATANVTIAFADGELRVCVEDSGRATGGVGSGGRGLVGMRERVGLYNGTLVVGERPGGGFRVDATLPFHAEATT